MLVSGLPVTYTKLLEHLKLPEPQKPQLETNWTLEILNKTQKWLELKFEMVRTQNSLNLAWLNQAYPIQIFIFKKYISVYILSFSFIYVKVHCLDQDGISRCGIPEPF